MWSSPATSNPTDAASTAMATAISTARSDIRAARVLGTPSVRIPPAGDRGSLSEGTVRPSRRAFRERGPGPRFAVMSALTRWVLAHKRIVVAAWIVLTVAGAA